MARHAFAAILLVALLAAPALAETTTSTHRDVKRVVASPTPLASARVLSDQHAWDLVLPAETVVRVTSEGNALHYLRTNRSGLWIPGTAQSFTLSEPGAWRVELDPVAGAQVSIRVRFQGFVADDDGGAAASFTLTDAQADRGCVVAGVCLP